MQELRVSGHLISNIGLKRPVNEDNYLINHFINEGALSVCEETMDFSQKKGFGQWAAVLDGMGGGERGERASFIAAQELRECFARVKQGAAEEEIEELARQGFLNANKKIIEERKNGSILGTTATLMCFCNNRAKLFHLGDCRAYLLREGRLYQLTKDQTLAALKIEVGIYKEGSLEANKDRHALTEYIGADETTTSIRPLESQWITLKPVDKILLCSDGLYSLCPDEEIREALLSGRNPEETAGGLVRRALAKGGTDNITCMVLTVRNAKTQAGGQKYGN